MENTVNNTNARIYVKDLGSTGGVRVKLVKHDGSEFSTSEVDQIFRKVFEYSEYGPNFIKSYDKFLVVAIENRQEGRDFIEGIASKDDYTDIKKSINVVSSENHETWFELHLARRQGDSFTDSEIHSIFWNAFKYPSLTTFDTSDENKEVYLYFRDIRDWREFVREFVYEDGSSNLMVNEPVNKTNNKGFWRKITETFKLFASE